MIIRNYNPVDSAKLYELYHDTIHNINIRDYNQEQIEAWAPENFDLIRWEKRVENYHVVVAEDNQGIAGFAELDGNGHIDCFYVHMARQGQGVGKLLIKSIEEEASRRNLPRLFAEVSITARPFFEHMAYQVVEQQQIEIRGQTLTNFRMEKLLK